MDGGLSYLLVRTDPTKSIVNIKNAHSATKYSSTGTLVDEDQPFRTKQFNGQTRRSTLEALDLHELPKTHKQHQPRSSLEHISTRDKSRGSLDGLQSMKVKLLPLLSRTKSDTIVGGNQGARQWLQNVNVEKTMANIDNSYERARGTKQQNAIQKCSQLLQRRISTQLKLDHLERELQITDGPQEAVKNKSPAPRRRVNQDGYVQARAFRLIQLRDELNKIDSDLRVEEAKRQGTLKDVNITRTKAIQVVKLLEAVSGDLPDLGPDSPDDRPLPKIVLTEAGSNSPTHKNQPPPLQIIETVPPTTSTTKTSNKQSSRLKGAFDVRHKVKPYVAPSNEAAEKNGSSMVNQLRRSKSKLKNLASVMDMRRNVRGFAVVTNNKKEQKDGGALPSVQPRTRTASGSITSLFFPTPHVKAKRRSDPLVYHNVNVKAKTPMESSSEDEGEIRTEISAETWNEIEAFEILIKEHLRRHRRSNEVLFTF